MINRYMIPEHKTEQGDTQSNMRQAPEHSGKKASQGLGALWVLGVCLVAALVLSALLCKLYYAIMYAASWLAAFPSLSRPPSYDSYYPG